MKINLTQNITIIKKSILLAYEINSIMLIPNTSAEISIFVYCDDNTLQQKTFMLIGCLFYDGITANLYSLL